ncbi:MAG: GlsB/YeaQ/YmgE family stress response membrane protein [Caldilineaceae bacterium]|nr:GlsB/YeaQ/YmgE family stress response membrane protein [Caldilineaceae bacterium]MBP8108734.1 GlsB/YeaQ/YmgE family stress response membrane protein [Caldilineaceae bacterium]MBP8124665.1 GlsB/YeaQ/YmgE family stress response membrane protein [Caldilineaceae bacterium]MBP9073917.1 GlsB/YeaQ/YmgE family stress response membrane protein [Caldilineaceae bacterium]
MNTSTIAEIVVWVIVGGLAGSLVGMLVRREQGGFGRLLNLLLGMAGAVIGGWLFNIFGINLGTLSQISVSFDQIVAATAGSLLVLLVVYLFQRWQAGRDTANPKVE